MNLSAQAAAAHTPRILADAMTLFPSGSHSIQLGGVPSTPPPSPPGESALAAGATAAGERYVSALATVRATDEGVNATVARAIAVGQQGRERAVRVLKSFQTKAAAILPSTNTPEGLRLLATTSQQHLDAMSGVIADTKASNATLAASLHDYQQQYQDVPAALGSPPKKGPPFATAPPKDPADPQNRNDVAQLYQDLAELNVKIAAHNLNPPPPNNIAAVAAYNTECEELNRDLLKLSGDFAVYGIEFMITPPSQGGTR